LRKLFWRIFGKNKFRSYIWLANANNCLIFDKKLETMIENILELNAPVALSDYEIERGKPMPDRNHSIIQGRLMSRLDRAYGDIFSILPEINLNMPIKDRVPDLAIYEPLTFDPNDNELSMIKPPLCAIEILSEMQNVNVLMKKKREYFTVGILSYWLVLPSLRIIQVFYSVEDSVVFTHKDRLVDKMLNIELDLGDIFR
jgi:Uma2 family endonuclease